MFTRSQIGGWRQIHLPSFKIMLYKLNSSPLVMLICDRDEMKGHEFKYLRMLCNGAQDTDKLSNCVIAADKSYNVAIASEDEYGSSDILAFFNDLTNNPGGWTKLNENGLPEQENGSNT